MAITEYSTPAQMQLIDTYSPVPFQELAAAGAARTQAIEQNLAMQDLIETDLGSFNALEQVVGEGGQQVEVGDKARLQQYVDGFTSRIEDLASKYKDPGSVGFRNETRKILTDLKRAKSPTGEIGQIVNNYNQYQAIRQQMAESEALGTSPHLAADLYEGLGQFARASMEGPASLSLQANLGKGVNVQEEVGKMMNYMKSSLLGEDFARSGRVPGFVERQILEGITEGQAKANALNVIRTNDRVQEDMRKRAKLMQQQGIDVTKEDLENNLATTMAGLFKQSQFSLATQADPFALHNLKKSEEEETKKQLLSTNMVVGVPKSMMDSPEKFQEHAAAVGTEILNLASEKEAFVRERGVDLTTGLDANGVDVSNILASMTFSVENAQERLKHLEVLDQMVKDEIGLPDNYIPDAETIKKARQKASTEYLNITSGKGTVPVNINIGVSAEEYIDQNYSRFLKEVDPLYKEYRETFEKLSEARAPIVGLLEVPKDYASKPFISDGLKTRAASFETAMNDVINPALGTSISKDEFEDFDLANGELQGTYWDPNTGNMMVSYLVPSKEKGDDKKTPKEYKSMAMPAPEGLDMQLVKDGYIDKVDHSIYRQLYRDTGAARSKSGFGRVVLGKGKSRMDFNVSRNVFNGQWTARIPTAGAPMEVTGVSESDIINKIATAYKSNLELLVKSGAIESSGK